MPVSRAVVEQRTSLLYNACSGRGFLSHSTDHTPEELALFGVGNDTELLSLLQFIEQEPPATEELKAAFNGLNLMLFLPNDETERDSDFLYDTYMRSWGDNERKELEKLKIRGLRLIATIFDIVRDSHAAKKPSRA